MSDLPRNFNAWNRAMQGAYLKGREAATNGGSLSDCPYADIRKSDGRLTWSRAFRAAWVDGFRDAAHKPNL